MRIWVADGTRDPYRLSLARAAASRSGILMNNEQIKTFFLPKITRPYLLRLLAVGVVTWVICSYFLIPVRISGTSMEPTYHDGRANVCWRWRYAFAAPGRGDIVVVRFSGREVMLLKRVVAVAGETVEFRDGVLHVDGEPLEEPYVSLPCDWDLPPRTVSEESIYVIGDNRSVPISDHRFGETPLNRIMGAPLW